MSSIIDDSPSTSLADIRAIAETVAIIDIATRPPGWCPTDLDDAIAVAIGNADEYSAAAVAAGRIIADAVASITRDGDDDFDEVRDEVRAILEAVWLARMNLDRRK